MDGPWNPTRTFCAEPSGICLCRSRSSDAPRQVQFPSQLWLWKRVADLVYFELQQLWRKETSRAVKDGSFAGPVAKAATTAAAAPP
mmetsp:Transcript_21376/g.32010  ORF Transcript_21376/g.32010 Transcript_21376/m.32010 type:complete len:86 (-) Transcript_21376:12-269(-)